MFEIPGSRNLASLRAVNLSRMYAVLGKLDNMNEALRDG